MRSQIQGVVAYRFNSFEVDQKIVLIHPRFMSPGRAEIFF